MDIKRTNKFGESRWLQAEVQTLAGEIAQSAISPRKYKVLSKKLDKTLYGLETQAKTDSLFAKAQAAHLKEQVVKLYGDLEEGLVKREISQIKEESTSLKKGRLTLRAIKKLETHIIDLEKNHLPSIPDRRILADAKQALVEARAKLDGKPILRHFDLIAQEKNIRFVEEVQLLPGEVEELLDIARAVYNRDLRQAKMRYAALPFDHQERFEKHMQHLMAKRFVDHLETIQAMLATVNDLVENGQGYPTQNEIDQLFLGISELNAEEKEGGKIVSLKSFN